MRNKKYYDERIESMIISKIATLRVDIRDKFRARHHEKWPELLYTTILGDIRDLRMWIYIAEQLKPFTINEAKKLTAYDT